MAAEPATPTAPPNLRASDSEDKECEVCSYYASGHCTAFPPLVVSGEWVCDHFKKGSRSDEDDVSSQPRSLKAAGARARDVLRAAKK